MRKQFTIDLVAAARPNFMKIAPLWHALAKRPWARARVIHTGQHYDYAMSQVFFEELGLPTPYANLGVGSGSHGQQTGRVLEAFEAHLVKERPDLVVVVGDVNATPAAALAAVKLHIPTAHLEAGLRSFERTMPEEINRLVTDTICDHLWTPSEDADMNLASEGIPMARVTRVGNIMIDTLLMLLPRIQKEDILEKLGLWGKGYAVVTLHRPSNVDSQESLKLLCELLLKASQKIPLVFPLHPRTRARLLEFGFMDVLAKKDAIRLLEPQPYCAFMRLVSGARIVVTDSGGVQEETSYLGTPCLTLRDNTERPITLSLGTNRLVRRETLLSELDSALDAQRSKRTIPLWDGKTAARVVQQIETVFSLS